MRSFLFVILSFCLFQTTFALVQEGDTLTCTLPDGTFRQECIAMTSMPTEKKMSPRVALQAHEWILQSYNGKKFDQTATIKFEKNRFYAKICNTMNGRYNLTVQDKLITRQVISTMMYCEGDSMQIESLFATSRFDLIVGADTLTLTTKKGDVLVWKKK